MDPEELLAKMQALTEELKSKEGQITEENLGEFMEGVSESLAQVFTLAQSEIERGLEQIEVAKSCLERENLHHDAEVISPLLHNVLNVQNQLEIGREVSQQERDFEGYAKVPTPEAVLTPQVKENLQRLEDALGG